MKRVIAATIAAFLVLLAALAALPYGLAAALSTTANLLPSCDPQPATTTTPDTTTTADITIPATSTVVSLADVLATIRTQESHNDYLAHSPTGSASGAYQFTDPTWGGFRGYAHATDAPPAIQDEKATLMVAPLLANWGLEGVPIGWYYPAALGDPSWLDRVPHPEAGNTLTIRQYQSTWLTLYAQISGSPTCTSSVTATGNNATVSAPCSGEITIDESIAARVEALLVAACADGIAFTGGGWRSAPQQIDLRRAHCGPTDYDIYDKPADQCQPPTARPGNSMHEHGLAIDFAVDGAALSKTSQGFRWLTLHAATYGLYNLPSEPWHWSTNGR